MSRPVVCPMLAFCLLLAGCSGGKAGEVNAPAATEPTVHATGSPFEGTATLIGTVANDENLPIEGADVGLGTTGLVATTGADGAFVFASVAAGTYVLYVQKLGYESLARSVTVEDGATERVAILLVSTPVDAVFHRTVGPYHGFLHCGYAVYEYGAYNCPPALGAVFGEPKNTFEFKMEAENLHAVVGEVSWKPSAVGTTPRLAPTFTHKDRVPGHWWCDADSPSPATFIWSVDENLRKCVTEGTNMQSAPEPTEGLTLSIIIWLPFASVNTSSPTNSYPVVASFQQKYMAVATLFYGQQPQPTFTALPDD